MSRLDPHDMSTLPELHAPQQPAHGSVVGHSDLCLQDLFERSADRHPHAVALRFRDTSLTYLDLDFRANRLARHLRAHGVRSGSLVGIFLERSELPIVALLAVLKAGAAYVPLDPVYPPDRIAHILETTGITILLSQRSLRGRVAGFPGTLIECDELSGLVGDLSPERLTRDETGVTPADLCYVIFTSGTTGRPKGIMTEHRNVVGFFEGFNRVIRLHRNDRVYQGFSLGFDGSVEEIWMAFTNGATLCVGTPEAARLGDEARRLLCHYGATVFSTVPTFLGLIREDIASLRLLIVSGEPCPPHLIDKWAVDSRRMLNVYGPTETTVNTTVALCKPGAPVTIGKPLDGYEIHILDERMQPVPHGLPGELYVGGVGVARGYFQQEELTRKAFLCHGPDSVLYRTGDQVCQNAEGELVFLGRVDSQVKVRGFRIELGEIESVLREAPSVEQAVIVVSRRNDLDELAAFVVPRNPACGADKHEIVALLNQRLPPYMVPAYLDEVEALPLLPSGKVDRKALPAPATRLHLVKENVVPPANPIEEAIVEVVKKVFSVEQVSVTDDFFADLGGYSLLIVEMIAALRREHELEVSVRDAYGHTSPRALASHVNSNRTSPALLENTKSSKAVFHSVPRLERWTCYALQLTSIVLMAGLATTPAVIFFWTCLWAYQGTLSIGWPVGIAATLAVLGYPLMLLLSIALKWLIVGRYRPGRYPLWSLAYFRFWLASRVQAWSGIGFAAGTPLMSLYFRLMGAKIGRNCIIDTPLCMAHDVVTIGDNTCIGSETQLLGYRIENGELVIGTVTIGNDCFVGTHSALGLDVQMEDGARLDDLSLLPDNARMGKGESWRGSPAKPGCVTLPELPRDQQKRRPFLFGCLHLLALEGLGLVTMATALPPLAAVSAAWWYGGIPGLLAALVATGFLGVFYYCLVVAGLKRLILPKVRPGTHSTESLFYLRKWLVDLILGASRTALHAVYTTIYFPIWLRILGAKVGKGAEISTVSQLYPDLTVIGDESFFADGSMIGGRRFFQGHVQLDEVRIGRRSFVGNNARLPGGGALGENSLLGCLSTLPEGRKCPADGTEWLGSPSFQLPHRRKECEFDVTEIFAPTRKLIATRCIIDALRIFTPTYLALTAGLAFVGFLIYGMLSLGLGVTLALAPIVSMALSIAVALATVALKWAVMGRFKPVRKPLWSVYVWLNELVNGVYETVAAPAMAGFIGTPFFNWFLRLLGCQIGKNCYIGTTLFSEFDLVRIGDHVALNAGVVVQNHLFEDRIMKSSYLDIGDECSVGNMSVVLYDSRIEPRTVIGPLSLVMKGDSVPPRTQWTGIPINQD